MGKNGDMRNFLREWQGELKRVFTGSVDALPEWVPRLAEGNDAGYHLPGSAVWAVHGSMTPIVGGIRALLMQALHPGALAGIHEHSDFRADPLSRLARTIRWIFTVTYGSTAAAEHASARVRRLHEPVQGSYSDRTARFSSTRPTIPELARWVHIAFVDAFLTAHKIWGGQIPGGPDAYVREWAQAGRLMGVEDPPLTEADMRQQLDRYYRERGAAGGQPGCRDCRVPPQPAAAPLAAARLSDHLRRRRLQPGTAIPPDAGARTSPAGSFPAPGKACDESHSRRRTSCPGTRARSQRAGSQGSAPPAGL